MNYTKKLNEFLSPDLLRQKLITASVFITVYENFKSDIIDNVKYFYFSGFEDGKEIFDRYEESVLSKVTSKNNRQIKATLLWYKEKGIITEQDIKNFQAMTDLRNIIGHDMLNRLFDGLPENILDTYYEMIALFEKITQWWIKEIEMPLNSDFTPDQYYNINWEEVTSVNLEFIKIMTDIAFTGNEKYLEILKKNSL